MKNELENITEHVDYLSSRYKDIPHAILLQREGGRTTMNMHTSSREHSECESRLSDSLQQPEAKEQKAVATESLADWGLVVCVAFSNMFNALDMTGFGVFYPYLVDHFEATTAAVGWCSSINGFFQSAVGEYTDCSAKLPRNRNSQRALCPILSHYLVPLWLNERVKHDFCQPEHIHLI